MFEALHGFFYRRNIRLQNNIKLFILGLEFAKLFDISGVNNIIGRVYLENYVFNEKYNSFKTVYSISYIHNQ